MERRRFLRHVGVVGFAGVAGCAGRRGGQDGSSVTPPGIVEGWSFTRLDDADLGPMEEPPNVQCVIGQSMRARGLIAKGASDRVEPKSMTYEDGTFELVVGVKQIPGGEAMIPGAYGVDVNFETPPDEIRIVENSVTRTTSQEIDCRERWTD